MDWCFMAQFPVLDIHSLTVSSQDSNQLIKPFKNNNL
jgi:hypothetical protein